MWKKLAGLLTDRPNYDRWYAPETWRAGQELSSRSPYRPSHRGRSKLGGHL